MCEVSFLIDSITSSNCTDEEIAAQITPKKSSAEVTTATIVQTQQLNTSTSIYDIAVVVAVVCALILIASAVAVTFKAMNTKPKPKRSQNRFYAGLGG